MLQKIVVPVDGSENSLRALDYAVALGKKFNSHIIVFNVAIPYDYTKIPPKKAKGPGEVEEAEMHKDTPLEIAEKHLASQPYGDLEYRQLVEVDPADRILDLVTHVKADAVVVGNRGMGHLIAFLAGSVSSKLISACPVPVIVVK